MAGDKTYITDNEDKLHRATRTKSVSPSSIVWSSNPNDYTVQVLVDGKWHRAVLTYDVSDAQFFEDINIDKALVTGGDGKTHTALIISPEESEVIMSPIPTDKHSLISGTTTGETVVNTYSENWSNVVWQDNVNVYKVLVEGSDGKKHTALLTTNVRGAIEVIVRGTSPISLPDAIADSLAYLKAFGGTRQGLPDGYIQRQFIYMTAGSYLLTDIVPTYDGHYELDFQTTTVSNVAAAYLGGRAGQSPAGLIFSHGSGNVLVTDAFGQRYSIVERVENNTRYKYVFNNKVFTLYKNGEVVETHTFTSSTDSGAALAIKAINMGDSIDFAGEGIYLYGFKAWNGQGELVADYVPAVQRGTVPVVGFYDTVSGTFKTATAGTFAAGGEAVPTPDAPMDIISNNGALKANKNLYGTEYNGYELSQVDGITLRANSGVNVSGKVDCRTIKSFKITTASPQGSFRIFKYRADNTYIDADSTASIGDIITLEDNVGFFRIQYNFTNSGTGTQNILIYNSAYDLNGIYADGTVETINVHGKNLFDATSIRTGARLSNVLGLTYGASTSGGSDFATDIDYYVSNLIPVEVGKTYIKKSPIADAYHRFKVYDANKVSVRISSENSITIQDSEAYIAFCGLQTELATAYCGEVLGTATTEMLLKVGDYEDVQSIIDGVVTRKVGVLVLDGTEDWSLTNKSFRFDGNISFAQPNTCLCTHFAGWLSTDSITAMPDLSIKAGHPTNTYRVYLRYDRFTTIEQLKSWLADQYAAGTPVIIVYPLATPTTESVAGQTMQVQQGDNIVEITQASMDNLELEAKYKKQA